MIDTLIAPFVLLYGAISKVDIIRLGALEVGNLEVDILRTLRYDQLDLPRSRTVSMSSK